MTRPPRASSGVVQNGGGGVPNTEGSTTDIVWITGVVDCIRDPLIQFSQKDRVHVAIGVVIDNGMASVVISELGMVAIPMRTKINMVLDV
jgi:hypothetical protein